VWLDHQYSDFYLSVKTQVQNQISHQYYVLKERDLLGLCSDNDSDYDEHTSNITSPNSRHLCTVNEKSGKKSDKFCHYLPRIGLRSTEWSLSLFLLDLELGLHATDWLLSCSLSLVLCVA
jgi:hypothetical protein